MSKNMITESIIRDNLARNLSVLESDLTLVGTEYYLPNNFGSTGRIDILARDRFSQYVVIELKRSNQTAKQAIHELHKYLALLQLEYRLPVERLRGVIVSTQWEELLVPFSEFVETTSYHIAGIKIEIDSQGMVVSATSVKRVDKPQELEFCPEHLIYLYFNEQNQVSSLKQLIRGLKEIHALNHCILVLNYAGLNKNVIYPFALYIALEKFTDQEKNTLAKTWGITYGQELISEENPWQIESEAFNRLANEITGPDTCEIGYPEKLFCMLKDWSIAKIVRGGRISKAEKLIADNELVRMLIGSEGQNAYFYSSFSSPQYKKNWERAISKATYSLKGNVSWLNGHNWFCKYIERIMPNAEVQVQVFNPMNSIMSLYKMWTQEDDTYLPRLEVIAVDPSGLKTVALVGLVRWDDKILKDPLEILNDMYGDTFNFFLQMHQGGLWETDEEIMDEIGLVYGLNIIIQQSESAPEFKRLDLENETTPLLEISETDISNLNYFIECNEWFLDRLVSVIQQISTEI